MTEQKARWKGLSSQGYEYVVYGLDTKWNDVPGNYIFVKIVNGRWVAVYIGQTDCLADRLPNHNERACAIRNGATHIHAHVNTGGEKARKAEEVDLIQLHKPSCNKQHKAA